MDWRACRCWPTTTCSTTPPPAPTVGGGGITTAIRATVIFSGKAFPGAKLTLVGVLAQAIQLGTNDSLKNRVHCFEVAWVCGQRNGNVVALGAGEGTFGAQVVLDVTGTLNGRGVEVAFKLAEDLTEGLAGHVGEYV